MNKTHDRSVVHGQVLVLLQRLAESHETVVDELVSVAVGKFLKVSLEVCSGRLRAGAYRQRNVLEHASVGREFNEMWSSVLQVCISATIVQGEAQSRRAHIVATDQEANTVRSATVVLRVDLGACNRVLA